MSYPEKIGRETILVSKEAEFFHRLSYPKSSEILSPEKCYSKFLWLEHLEHCMVIQLRITQLFYSNMNPRNNMGCVPNCLAAAKMPKNDHTPVF